MNWMDQMGIRPELQKEVAHFRERFDKDTAPSSVRDAAEVPRFHYLGKDILEKAICALLCEKNLLLAGPKATGKNVLAENLPSLLECFFSYQCGCFLSDRNGYF